MTLEFSPLKGVGNIFFEEKRTVVRNKINNEQESFKKYIDKQETDVYKKSGLVIYYEEDSDTVNLIESYCKVPIYFKEINLCDTNYNKTIEKLSNLGYLLKKDAEGYQCDELGLGFYIPCEDLEGVSFFKRGYYNE